jgi:phage gp46-like protein
LGIGSNIFEWSVSLCDQQSKARITVEKVVIPSPPMVELPAPYCQDELIRPLIAKGENIEWFSDPQMSQNLAIGTNYHPLISQTDTLYVTQTVHGYRSNALRVIIQIKPAPAAPQAPAVVYYCKADKSIRLTANGENIEWYADKQLSSKIGSGSPFTTTLTTDTTVYAIQRLEGCASMASAVILKAGVFAPKDLYLANVITPMEMVKMKALRP